MYNFSETYPLMQDIISNIIELYHTEVKNLDMYKPLLEISPNKEDEEIILDIIETTIDNISYLSQMYLGLTGEDIDQSPMPQIDIPDLSFFDLLRNVLFSKIDTLNQYEELYKTVPMQPYKDILFKVIINQLKNASLSNFLISSQSN